MRYELLLRIKYQKTESISILSHVRTWRRFRDGRGGGRCDILLFSDHRSLKKERRAALALSCARHCMRTRRNTRTGIRTGKMLSFCTGRSKSLYCVLNFDDVPNDRVAMPPALLADVEDDDDDAATRDRRSSAEAAADEEGRRLIIVVSFRNKNKLNSERESKRFCCSFSSICNQYNNNTNTAIAVSVLLVSRRSGRRRHRRYELLGSVGAAAAVQKIAVTNDVSTTIVGEPYL